ncbi:phage portal protein [Streptomyces sp. NPDC006458]|uniref:phage portal protein n=1 Tax=Streptomyces sp. NPDC006458 TaxID=3154302 RepID=UPI0033AACF6A
MSLFTRIRERRSLGLTSPRSTWEDEFSGLARRTFSGKRVSRDGSLQMISVYACQSLIADGIASLPVDHFSKVTGKKTMLDGAKSPRWIRQPNPFQTAYAFWHRVIVSLLSDGNAFLAIIRNDAGVIQALYCLHPQDVQIEEGPAGDDQYRVTGVPELLGRGSILHIPAFTVPGCSRGLSPLDMAREAIGLGMTAEEFGARFFSQGTTMAGVIEHPGTPRPDEARLLRSMFKKTHAGINNSHTVGVLTGGASFKPISITPEQAQFLETRRFQKTEIALLYRVPAYLVDSSVTSTWGSGIEEQNRFFVDQTLMPWIVRIEQAVSTFLLPGQQFIKFNLDARLRSKTKDRYESYRTALTNGFMTADEIRALEDMEPLPKKNGQHFYMPLNLAIVGEEKAPAPAPEAPVVPDEQPSEAPDDTPPDSDQGEQETTE